MEPYSYAPFGRTNHQESAKSLTKREFFAAMAMLGRVNQMPIVSLTDIADIASESVDLADALIDALNES